MIDPAQITAIAVGTAATCLACAVLSEARARRRERPWLMAMAPKTPPRLLNDGAGFFAMAILAFTAAASPIRGLGPDGTLLASALAMTALAGLNGWSHLDARRRRRRAAAQMRRILGADVGSRIKMDGPASLFYARSDWRDRGFQGISWLNPSTHEAAWEAFREEIRGLAGSTRITLHPLPASATLRAAMQATGSDPMDAKGRDE